jgi:hypothetical protein
MKIHQGGCHCGAVTFTVEADIEKAMECNCSHCAKKGFLLVFVPRAQFTLLTGEDNLTEYLFNKKHIRHLFCKTCGVQAFGYGKGHDGSEMNMVNARCLPDLDLPTLTITQVDGKSY